MTGHRSVLAVFAHPDDEAFGTGGSYYRYSSQGVTTALICATRGEEGEISHPSLATPDTLGEVREREMRAAADAIGVSDLTFLDFRDGTLAQVNPEDGISAILRAIRRLRPQVVITFDHLGGYGHPDHIAIHNWTVAAFDRARDALADGLEPSAPQKLYAVAFARSVMHSMREAMRARGGEFRPGGDAATIPLDEMGVSDDEITTTIELTDEELDAKMRGMLSHRTQMPAESPMASLPPDVLSAWLGTERFVLLTAPETRGEHDLFAGVVA